MFLVVFRQKFTLRGIYTKFAPRVQHRAKTPYILAWYIDLSIDYEARNLLAFGWY